MSFKYRPDKLKFNSSSYTIDELHKDKISQFGETKNLLPLKEKQLLELKKKLEELENKNKKEFNMDDIKNKSLLKQQIENLEFDINDINNNFDELEYYYKTNDILMEYYNNYNISNSNLDIKQKTLGDDKNISQSQVLNNEMSNITNEQNLEQILNTKNLVSDKLKELNKISQIKRKNKKIPKKKKKTQNNDILKWFIQPDVSSNEMQQPIEEVVSNKGSLYDEYMLIMNSTYFKRKNKNSSRVCIKCNKEKEYIVNEGKYYCPECGEVEYIIMESEVLQNNDNTMEKNKFPYKRMNHFIEQLNQFQAKETTEISDDVIEKIVLELKRQRIYDKFSKMEFKKTRKIIKSILKKIRSQLYYEHIPYIISKITGNPPPTLTRDQEETLKNYFKMIQEPFNRYCPSDRVSFLNYSYIFNKFFRKMGLNEYAECFPLLKSKNKLRTHDTIWRNICKDLDWEFYPSI
jgi:predicted RNA-binding Zn-ribbon protein involved in translation (DUF1610 family)